MGSSKLQKLRESKKLIILVVAVALGLDNIILTVIVPILPALLYEIEHPIQWENGAGNSTGGIIEESEQTGLISKESAKIGYMLASKSIVQLIANPIVGPLTLRVGFVKPMFLGFVVMFTSTLLFAFGNSYPVLLFARAFQGIGSSCSSVAGMAMLASTFPDNEERAKAMALAFTGLSFGVIVGPPFGGIMYQLVNKTAPFLIICCFTLIDGCLLLFTMKADDKTKELNNSNPPSILALIKDGYILLVAGGIFMVNIGIGFVETGLPIWLLDVLKASRWEVGLSLLPCTISYLLGVNIFRPIRAWIGRWRGAVLLMFMFGISFIALSLVNNKIALILPLASVGLFCGATEIALFPELGRIVDVRYTSAYGNVYAIGDFALCLGFAIGPILCGVVMKNGVGFERLNLICGILCVLISPLFAFLKNITDPDEDEKKPLIEHQTPFVM